MAKRDTKAKRERDGWRVERNLAGEFRLAHIYGDYALCFTVNTKVAVHIKDGIVSLPPARAAQFAAKVAAIAAKAAKEAKDGR